MSTFTIEIKAPELAEAINNLAAAYASQRGLSNLHERPNTAEPYGKAELPKTAANAAHEKESSAKEDNTSAEEDSANDVAYTIEDVRAAFSAYAKAKGKEKAKELLAKFGANKVTALDSANYTAVMNYIKEV